jgi:hypothetical protein
MTETSPEQTTPEPRQVDAVVALAETMAIIVSGILELMPPYSIQEGDVVALGKLQRNQQLLQMGMNQLHTLLAMMGSPMVQGAPEESEPVPTPVSSGIILPGQGR